MMRAERQKLIPRARGRVLEVGLGSGHNLPFYVAGQVERVWGLEPDETMRRLCAAKARAAPFEVEFLDLPGEQIPLEDDSADTVVTTFTLCTIPGVEQALAQMRRVLKPGGELLFLEHGAAPDENVLRWQHRVEPTWKKLFGGCHLSRPIDRLIEANGFKVEEIAADYLDAAGARRVPDLFKIAGFRYRGVARPG
jgi:ubiquinone/menaquinone biosynthesis C-methylase UbiE